MLAAGLGRRMGGPKWTLQMGEMTLLECHVHRLLLLDLEVIVVAGTDAEMVRARLPSGVTVRVNPDPGRTDMATSLAIGLQGVARAFVMPVDVAPVRRATIAALQEQDRDAVPTFGGRDGHPVLVVPPHPPGRLDHRLVRAARVPVVDPWCVEDFDTSDAWARFLASPRARESDEEA